MEEMEKMEKLEETEKTKKGNFFSNAGTAAKNAFEKSKEKAVAALSSIF